MTTSDRKSVYQIISEQILKALDCGTIPWRKPWKSRGGQRNVRGTPYRGINQVLLQMVAMEGGYESNVWLTFNQAKTLGGNVKKGQHGTPIVFWKFLDKKQQNTDGTVTDHKVPLLRYYTVFNISQCENITVVQSTPETPVEPIAECDRIVADMPQRPEIMHGGDKACYRPATDTVHMPSRVAFSKPEDYYSTLFHELGHSVGHPSRLNRKGVSDIQAFGSHNYGTEELVAEFTSAFLCGVTGISPSVMDNSAAYIDHWKKAIRVDDKMVVMAAAQAQKSADFIMGVGHKDDEEKDDNEG